MHLIRKSLFGLMLPVMAGADHSDILLNAQGFAQQDLSIRGSSYSGAGISINGLNLKVPYSAHFNSDVPFMDSVLSEPDRKTGLENAAGHLIGTAAYSTPQRTYESLYSASIGSKERYQATLFGSTENIGGFIDGEKARTIDYDANDLKRYTGGAFVQFEQNNWLFDFLTGSESKTFGTQGYYGIPGNVYAEEETDDDLLFFSASKGNPNDDFLRASASFREFNDYYIIPSSAFEHEVLSRYGAVAAEGRTLEIQNIALFFRGDLEHERVSGDIGSHDRTRGSILLLPEARFERFVFKAGMNSVFQTDESADVLPLAEIDWLATDNSTVYAAYSETVQQPDFQTLYYNGPFRNGNTALAQQHASSAELGFRQFLSASLDWHLAGFFRELEQASDWVAGTATDLGTLDTSGLESGIGFYPSESLNIRLFYQWLHKNNETENGLYETDYPEHLLNLSVYWKLLDVFAVDFYQSARWQTENTVRTSDDFGTVATLGLHYFPRFADKVRLSLLADNLWDSDFQAVPGLKPRPFTVSAGVALAW